MQARLKSGLHNHAHVLLIVPLIVIVMTWPVLPELFNGEAFWLHTYHPDALLRIWDSWHVGKVLAGQAELWHTVDMFHPRGASLVVQSFSFPHALLMLALNKVMPTDSAYNLLFILILCFNGFSAYVLIQHLLKDKWVALFGAVVAVLAINFSHSNTVPDLICIGTLPLTLYFFHRALFEGRPLFAALAGFCAGITAFIAVYILAFILLSVALYAAFLLPARWRQREFWRLLIVFCVLCAAIGALRIYPMLADETAFQEGLTKYDGWQRSHDVLQFFVHSRNPFTGSLLHSLFNAAPNAIYRYKIAYLGYINLFFLACALLHKKGRKGLLPWATLFILFALMRLGDFLSYSGVAYRDIVLPHRVLVEYFPTLFGQIGDPRYYLYALVVPLSLLSSFGLAALIRKRSARTRALVSLAAVMVVAFEFYAPISRLSFPNGATAYINWLKSEPDDPIRLINLPHQTPFVRYGMYVQTLSGYPIASGFLWRTMRGTGSYLDRNLLLREWRRNNSGHWFGRKQAYQEAVDELLSDGFSHIVVHHWDDRADRVLHSFLDLPAAYDDGLVRIYRLADMRLGSKDLPPELAVFDQFLESPWGAYQPGSSLLSFHPHYPLDKDPFTYLDAAIDFTTKWGSLLHLDFDQGEPTFQSAAGRQVTAEEFTDLNQVIYVVTHSREADLALLKSTPPLDQYYECGRQIYEDGWIVLRLLRHEFSCALFSSPAPLQARYDNGAHLANLLVVTAEGGLEVQLRWATLPFPKHAFSVQFFDKSGTKAHNQDFVVGDGALARHHIDFRALPPGAYAVKLVVYNFESRRSVSGTASKNGERFKRELEIATIDHK
ncbi:MAG: hypothetical protein OXG68_10720 [Chloroflexi bacterium]|nr:hypothetical protein [Chloroflexota bacterium]